MSDAIQQAIELLSSSYGDASKVLERYECVKALQALQHSGEAVRVFGIGEFYNGTTDTEVTERESVDSACQQDYVEWTDDDDKKYRIHHATPHSVVPEGYVLVPVEPTEAMIDAGYRKVEK